MQSLTCLQKLTLSILKSGHIPTHIGFIMDGNRRYAKKHKLSTPLQGHVQGVQSLKKCLLVCKELGIREVSLFCFSVENFSRSKEEVQGLMELCLETFREMSGMQEMLLREEIKVNIIGRVELLRQDVRQALLKIQQKTQHFTKTSINLCFAYDSRHQIQTSLQNSQSQPHSHSHPYHSFISNLAIPHHLDILVRTANEHRLSNFMLPQSAYAYICILKESWPEINLLSFVRIMLGYNYCYRGVERSRRVLMREIGGGRVDGESEEERKGLMERQEEDSEADTESRLFTKKQMKSQ